MPIDGIYSLCCSCNINDGTVIAGDIFRPSEVSTLKKRKRPHLTSHTLYLYIPYTIIYLILYNRKGDVYSVLHLIAVWF